MSNPQVSLPSGKTAKIVGASATAAEVHCVLSVFGFAQWFWDLTSCELLEPMGSLIFG